MTRAETTKLRALVLRAWELRSGSYVREAAEAIIAWHERRPLAMLEAEQAFEAAYGALVAAYPDRYGRRSARAA